MEFKIDDELELTSEVSGCWIGTRIKLKYISGNMLSGPITYIKNSELKRRLGEHVGFYKQSYKLYSKPKPIPLKFKDLLGKE